MELAKTVSKKELEKRIATAAPGLAVWESAKYVQADRIKIQLGVSEDLMKMVERVQDIVSQKSRKVATIEDAVRAMAELYIEREDPLEKAKRWHKRNANLNLLGPGQVNVGGASRVIEIT